MLSALKSIIHSFFAGQVPGALRGVDEHGTGAGAAPLQPTHLGDPLVTAGHAEGHQGAGGDGRRPGGRLRLDDGGQGAGHVDGPLLPVTQTAGQLRHRPHCQAAVL